jgi:hypothetical protein
VTPDPRYVAARRVLLDALEALNEHLNAIVVAGAQAVYLRTGEADIGVAAFTTDGDLALDASKLGPAPLLGEVLALRFGQEPEAPPSSPERQTQARRPMRPGVWKRTVEVDGLSLEVPIDLIVPEGIAPPGGSRAARLGPHGKQAARKAPGLEATVVDHDPIIVGALEAGDDREIRCNVAGPTALLIAKAHKIQDRLDQPDRPDRLIDKDASDVYRLMQTTPPQRVNEVAAVLLSDERVAEASRHGLKLLRQQFGHPRASGVQMAVRSLRLGVPEARVRTVCTAFTAALDPPTTPTGH